jgi:hypothetical protein
MKTGRRRSSKYQAQPESRPRGKSESRKPKSEVQTKHELRAEKSKPFWRQFRKDEAKSEIGATRLPKKSF